MGKYFDYEPVKPWAGTGTFFSSISDGLEDLDKQRAQDAEIAQKKASTEAYVSQIKATNKKLQLDEERDKAKFSQWEAEHAADTVKKVTADAAANRYGEAEATATASQRIDPLTGKRIPGTGVGFTRDTYTEPEAPVEPVAPQKRVDPVAVAQMFAKMGGADADALAPDPEKARAQAMFKAQRGSTQPPAPGSADELLSQAAGEEAYGGAKRVQDDRARAADEQRQYERRKADYDVQNAAYEPTKAAYDEHVKHPDFTIEVNKQKTHYTPEEAKNAQIEDARKQAFDMRTQAALPTTSNEVRAMLLTAAANVEARIPAAPAAAVTNSQLASSAHEATNVQNDKKNATAITVAKIHGKGKGKGTGGGSDLPTPADQRVLGEIDKAMEENTRKGGLRENLTHSEGTIHTLAPQGPKGPLSENPIDWVNAIDAAIRVNTGRAAILSQYKLYTGKAAGADDTAEQLWAGFKGANLSPTQKANLFSSFLNANSELRRESKTNYDKMNKYATDPRVSGHRAIKLGYDARMNNTFGGMPGYNNQPGAADVQPPPPPMTPEDQAAVGEARARLAKNPNDPVAKEVLGIHGLKE